MKQTARNPTNYLHRRFFATIQDHYVYVLRCVHLYTPLPSPLSLYSEIDPRAPNFPRSPLVSRIFRLPCVQAIPSSVCVRRRVSSTFFHERKGEKLVTFEKKKKNDPLSFCNMYRVDGGIVRWSMRERRDGNPFTTEKQVGER